MKRRVSELDASQHLAELLENVSHRGDEVTIERAGQPVAVVIPMDRHAALERGRERLLAFIDKVQSANADGEEAEVSQQIEEALREVRGKTSARGA